MRIPLGTLSIKSTRPPNHKTSACESRLLGPKSHLANMEMGTAGVKYRQGPVLLPNALLFRLCNLKGKEGKEKLSVQLGKRSLADLNDVLSHEFWLCC